MSRIQLLEKERTVRVIEKPHFVLYHGLLRHLKESLDK